MLTGLIFYLQSTLDILKILDAFVLEGTTICTNVTRHRKMPGCILLVSSSGLIGGTIKRVTKVFKVIRY